jgi:hypothetical protein
MKILAVGAESFHVDGDMDRHDEANGSGFGGLGVACWPLVPKFAEAVGFLRAKKSSSRLPSEGK